MEESIFVKNLKEMAGCSRKANELGESELEKDCLFLCECLGDIIKNEPIDPQKEKRVRDLNFKSTGNVKEWFEKELESLKKEIKCPKCGSANIKEIEDKNDFLSYKAEGEAVERQIEKTKQKYLCLEENCGHKWEEDLFN